MKDQIIRHLDQIELKHGVKIILACESGSRAWGFPSTDSDFDVRFIYVNAMDWYLSITDKRDVIELPIDDTLDISGWDLRKSLQLMRKSNSPLLEWLSSPIRYRVWDSALKPILDLSEKAFMPETSCHHYLSMAKASISRFDNTNRVKLKAYMYAIRPVLCCEWIIKNLRQPPMFIGDLISDLVEDSELGKSINTLISIKSEHSEKYLVERSTRIEKYLNDKIVELEGIVPKNPSKPKVDEFDKVFINILDDISKHSVLSKARKR